MRAKKNKELEEMDEEDEVDYDLTNYNASNDPFGRGGAGAPLRDQYGNMITTRKP